MNFWETESDFYSDTGALWALLMGDQMLDEFSLSPGLVGWVLIFAFWIHIIITPASNILFNKLNWIFQYNKWKGLLAVCVCVFHALSTVTLNDRAHGGWSAGLKDDNQKWGSGIHGLWAWDLMGEKFTPYICKTLSSQIHL